MSLGRIFTVLCDSGRSHSRCRLWVAQERSSKEARKVARRAGWKRRAAMEGDRFMNPTRSTDNIDVCPDCQEVTP